MGKYRKSIRLWVLCLAALILTGCSSASDVSDYTRAVLELTFQGEPSKALAYMEEPSEEALMQEYQAFIEHFVEGNITNEIDVGEIKTSQFAELISKIFATMRYEVGEAEKIGGKEYEVPVKIQPSDVFVSFYQALTEDSLIMAEKVREGEYEGTEEEISRQLLNDIVNHAYELLDVAYMDTQYGKSETVTLRVTAEKKKEYVIDDEDMNQLIIKILRLDEIQG